MTAASIYIPVRSTAPIVVEGRDLWKSFDGGKIPVIRGAGLRVYEAEVIALWGSSGSGKSTLLHLLSGLDAPDQGTVSILGLDPRSEVNRLLLRREKVGFVFQLHHLIPDLTVDENLRLPAIAAGRPALWTQDRIAELTEKVGLSHRRRHRSQDLSGGERQRVAICRALMNKPRIIFADEPTGALDETTGTAVFAQLCELAEKEKTTLVIATHERRFLESCHRVIRVHDGKASDL